MALAPQQAEALVKLFQRMYSDFLFDVETH
jgi:hypothetical protein